TDARGTRDVVDAVAHQAQQVDDLVRRHAELILDPLLVAPLDRRDGDLTFYGRRILPHRDDVGVADELAEVFVVRDDNGLQPLVRRLTGKGADDVVRLIAIEPKYRDIKDFADPFDIRELVGQVLRH